MLIDYIKWQQEELDKRRQADGMAAWKAKLQADKFALLPPCPGLTDAWKPLVEFKAPKEVSDRLRQLTKDGPLKKAYYNSNTDPWYIQSLENADGTAINLDYFPIRVSSLPILNGKQSTAAEFLEYIRLNINHSLDQSKSSFQPHPLLMPAESERWLNSPLGSVIMISIPGDKPFGFVGDDGSVIVSDYQPDSWTFSTIHEPQASDHPVSGNRQFGYTQNADGSYIFYTRGADKLTGTLDDLLGLVTKAATGEVYQFSEADNLWRSFQKDIADFVNQNGGSAQKQAPVTNRPDWEKVKDAIKNNRNLSTVDCN